MVGFIFIVLIWIVIGLLMRPKREAMIWAIIEPIQKLQKETSPLKYEMKKSMMEKLVYS